MPTNPAIRALPGNRQRHTAISCTPVVRRIAGDGVLTPEALRGQVCRRCAVLSERVHHGLSPPPRQRQVGGLVAGVVRVSSNLYADLWIGAENPRDVRDLRARPRRQCGRSGLELEAIEVEGFGAARCGKICQR